MPGGGHQKTAKHPGAKKAQLERCLEAFSKYRKCLIVSATNVNATQMLHIRHDLMGKAEVLFGKNSMMRIAVKQLSEGQGPRPDLAALMPELYLGAGLIFTDGPFSVVSDVLTKHCVGSPAKVGAISPVEIIIPPMKTTMTPTQVNVLHALNIQSKIFKGTIEITSEKLLVKVGDKVGASEANLLGLLGITPFKYGVVIRKVFDGGHVYGPDVLQISDDVLQAKFAQGLANVAAVSLALGIPNEASGPHLVAAAFKHVAAVAIAADIPLPAIAEIQALLADPEALAKAQAAAASQPAAAPAAAQEEAKAEEKKEEDEDDGGGMDMDLSSLFD